ncbi:MAG: tetratricopeptide repeat protein [Verrucomicrobia bacterium]|nr:tetratricopeptide repeat protein [Verrucomicrobiota bacterium]
MLALADDCPAWSLVNIRAPCLEALAARERVLGPEHPDTLASVSNLGSLFGVGVILTQRRPNLAAVEQAEQQGRTSAELSPEQLERALEAKRASGQTDDPQFAVDLNNYALRLRKLGRYDEAAKHLEEAISIEDRFLPAEHPKRAHRRNNLSIVLMLANDLEAATAANAETWQLKRIAEGGHDRTSGRILFARIALSWLQGQDPATPIGQLRTLLAQGDLPCHGNINLQWKPADILDVLKPRLSPEQHQFLATLVTVLNDQARIDALDSFPLWRDSTPQPLD